MKDYISRNRNMLFTLGAGLGIGAALGVLFAPDKGVKTRSKLRNQGNALAEQARERTEELMERIRQTADKGEDEVQALKREVRKLSRKMESELSNNS